MATKADLREYESAIRNDLEKLEMKLESRLVSMEERTDAKLEKLGTKLHGKMTLLQWMLGVIALSVVPLAIKTFLHF